MPKGQGGNAGNTKYLAVAFTDLNGDDKFSANKDTLIAGLVDTNHDKTVSVGDIVQFGTFPLLSGAQAGTFNGPDTPVTSVDQASSDTVVVEVASGTVTWMHTDPFEERFMTQSATGVDES